jgi:hypothetical protein
MKLVELETKEEYDAILKIFKEKEDSLHSYHYLGVQADESGEWKWINGEKVSYETSFGGIDSDEEQFCVQYSKSSSKYFSFSCYDDLYEAVCEKEEKKIAGDNNEAIGQSSTKYEKTTKPNEPELVEIPDGFEKIGEFGMKF